MSPCDRLRGFALLAFFTALFIFIAISLSSLAVAQAGSATVFGPAHPMTVAPPTGSVAPPTASIAPPTGATAVHNGYSAAGAGGYSTHVPHAPAGVHNPDGHHPPHAVGPVYYYPYFYPAAVPYTGDGDQGAVTDDAASNDDATDVDAEYQEGPIVFDHRRSDSYAALYEGSTRAEDSSSQDLSADEADSQVEVDSPQPATILVFKDGHQLEVANYAIVGETLYDLTPDHARKIALAALDLPSTEKKNDDQGIVFQLPASAQGN